MHLAFSGALHLSLIYLHRYEDKHIVILQRSGATQDEATEEDEEDREGPDGRQYLCIGLAARVDALKRKNH